MCHLTAFLAELVFPCVSVRMWEELSIKENKKGKVPSATDWLPLKKDHIKFNNILKLIQKVSLIDQASYWLKDTTCFLSVQNWSKELTGKRKCYSQEGQRIALSTRIKPTTSWLSLWFFHHFLSSIPKTQHSNAIQLGFLWRKTAWFCFHTKKTFPIVCGVSTVLGQQQSCVLLDLKKEVHNWKRGKMHPK